MIFRGGGSPPPYTEKSLDKTQCLVEALFGLRNERLP